MKLMKNTMKCLVAVFMMAMAFAVTGVTAEAAEKVARTFDKSIDGVTVIETQEIKCLGEAGIYEGGYVEGLRQTAATLSSVTLTWDAVYGAAGYCVLALDEYGDVYNVLTTAQTNSVTLTVPEGTYGAGIGILPVDADGDYSSYYTSIKVYAQPKKITGLKYNGVFGDDNKLNVIWDDAVCYGFEAVCYNKKGKVVQTIDESYYRSTKFSKTNSQNIYSVKVRGYNLINGGTEKIYGDYSKTFYAVPQPKITTKKSDLKRNSVNLKWKKVNGATKYDIYVSRSQNSGYKKVATVKSSKKSYKITKFKGKTLNIHNKTHYIKIVTYGKFGKKTVKSSSKPQLSVYTYTTYY